MSITSALAFLRSTSRTSVNFTQNLRIIGGPPCAHTPTGRSGQSSQTPHHFSMYLPRGRFALPLLGARVAQFGNPHRGSWEASGLLRLSASWPLQSTHPSTFLQLTARFKIELLAAVVLPDTKWVMTRSHVLPLDPGKYPALASLSKLKVAHPRGIPRAASTIEPREGHGDSEEMMMKRKRGRKRQKECEMN